MTEQRHANEGAQVRGSTGTTMKRRGILAAAGAVVAGIAAKQISQPVAAGPSAMSIPLGAIGNSTTTETGVLNSGPASPGGPAIHGFRSPGAVTVVSNDPQRGLVGGDIRLLDARVRRAVAEWLVKRRGDTD